MPPQSEPEVPTMSGSTLTTPPIAGSAGGDPIAASTALGPVALTVTDLARSRAFYETALGLQATDLADGGLAMGVAGGPALVELRGDVSAPPLDRRATGLYHLAVLVPSRPDLAHALMRLARARWPLDGASDHLVSEALYLSDPDGNGIEIYRDRPRAEWRYDTGALQMATLPLDLQGIADELRGATAGQPSVPAGTTIGHVHLQVSDLRAAEAFYHGVLGFDVVVRGYPGALFVSAGGYHHHVGLNTWHSARSGPPAPGSVGLRTFTVLLPDDAETARVVDRAQAAGLPIASGPNDGALLRDPAGNGVVLATAPRTDQGLS
jgi:catechol 2,3-dioxygenase